MLLAPGLATAYSGPRVERTAHSQTGGSVLKSIIDVERGEVAGHRVLQPQQTSGGVHQNLPSTGSISRPDAPGKSPVLMVRTDGPTSPGKLSWRIYNYLG